MIYSESRFKYRKHALNYVYGLAGISWKDWKSCPFADKARYDDTANIWAGAWILRYYLGKSKGNYREALTYYKGYCTEGACRADKVLTIRRRI